MVSAIIPIMRIERRTRIGIYWSGAAFASFVAVSGFMSQYSGEGARLNEEAALQASRREKPVSPDDLDKAKQIMNVDIPDNYSQSEINKAIDIMTRRMRYQEALHDARQSNGAADQYEGDMNLMYEGIGVGTCFVVYNYIDKKFIRRRERK